MGEGKRGRNSRVSTLGRRKMEEPSGEEEDQDGLSVQSAGQAPPSSASSLPKVFLMTSLISGNLYLEFSLFFICLCFCLIFGV